MQKVKVVGKDKEGKEVSVFVKSPSIEDKKRAKEESNRTFRDAVKSGALLQAKTEETLKDQGLWNEEKKAALRKLEADIDDLTLKLKKGGIKKSEGKDVAIKVNDLRQEQLDLVSVLRSLDEFTAESQATDAHFDTLCARCIVDDYGNPKFKNMDEYREVAETEWVRDAASKLAELVSVFDPEWRKKLPENDFLIKYGFMNSEMTFVDNQGRTTDREGRLIDPKTRRYINENGELINRGGERVDDEGNVLVEFSPFLDDDGKPIILGNGEHKGNGEKVEDLVSTVQSI